MYLYVSITLSLCNVFTLAARRQGEQRSVQGVHQEFDEHFELLTWTGGARMRYENRWENGVRRVKGAKAGCAPRHAGKWCRVHGLAVLAASRRESRREASPPPPSVWLRLRRHCLFFPISSRFCRAGRSSVCVVAMTTIVSGKVVRTQKYQTSVLSFLRRRVRRARGWTRGLRYEREALAPLAKGLRRYVRDAAETITFHCRAPFCNLRLYVPF